MRDFKVLHLETTDVCQAACPLCSRETKSTFDKTQKNHLQFKQIQEHFTTEQLAGLDKVFACGNYGDPAAGKYTLDIFKQFRDINPAITIGLHSNGGLRTTEWWTDLAHLIADKGFVVFSIDGLEDTNHIYRKNVDWNILVKNAKAFIDAGGNAFLDMLVYQHNQHQVNSVEQFARDMGFSHFGAKVSKRPFIKGLEFPIGWEPANYKSGSIKCHVLQERSFYIDARGKLYPCCWLGDEARDDRILFEDVQASWQTENPYPVCARNCVAQENKSSFHNQWKRSINFR